MGETTGISWCDHTFNTHWGCRKISPECDNCYAENTSNRYGFKIWGADSERRFFGDQHWAEPIKWNTIHSRKGTRGKVFCASMSDVMEDREDLSSVRLRLYELIKATKNLDWLLLTKRPENFTRFLPGSWTSYPGEMPTNIWGMTTVGCADSLRRIEDLNGLPFKVRGVSAEPLLESFSIGPRLLGGVGWVIVGAESGHGARPTPIDWVRNLRDECQRHSVPFFVKQLVIDGKLTKDIMKFPPDLQIQEFPFPSGTKFDPTEDGLWNARTGG